MSYVTFASLEDYCITKQPPILRRYYIEVCLHDSGDQAEHLAGWTATKRGARRMYREFIAERDARSPR